MHIPTWLTSFLTIWGVIGPFLGIFLGHKLSIGSQRKQRLADHKKEDYQAVLTAVSTTLIAIMRNRVNESDDPTENEKLNETIAESLVTMHSRIYIAKELQEINFAERWKELVKGFQGINNATVFNQKADSLTAEIQTLARQLTE